MNRKRVLIAAIILGVLASVYVAVLRYKVESLNKAVEIVVDYDEMQQLASISGKTTSEVLSAFKGAGITSCAVSSLTLKDLVDDGQLIRTGPDTYAGDNSVIREAVEWLSAELPAISSKLRTRPLPNGKVELTIALPWSYAMLLPVSFDSAPEMATQAGIKLIARVPNYKGTCPQSVDAVLRLVKARGITKVIFDGDQVLGFKGCEKETGEAFVRNGMYFGKVEFSKQKGEEKIARAAQLNTVVVHSITQAEMPNLSEATIQDRFQKAVRERGVRVCYVRTYNTAGSEILSDNVKYIKGITKAIEKAGYEMKPAHPLEELVVPTWARILAGLGVAAGILMLLITILDIDSHSYVLTSVIVFLICLVGSGAGETGRKAVALLGALVFPTLGAILSARFASPQQSGKPAAAEILKRFVGAIAMSVCGGLLVVGLLSQRTFMLRLDTFMGVKAAHFLPIIILAALYAGGIAWKSGNWKLQKETLVKSYKQIAANPILVWQAAGMIVVLVLLALMVARSGNDSGLEVSSLELRFRAILDKILYVRPRTKEFLIGYPALICGIAFAMRGKKNWAAPCIVLGCFGLVSALNTFCHIHTPIVLSLIRVFNGMWVGAIIGWIVYSIVRFMPGNE